LKILARTTLLLLAGVAAAQSCALPDDFVKVEAIGIGVCQPAAGDIPSDCDSSLLSDGANCCFTGRSCGAGSECVAGDCTPLTLSQMGGNERPIGILLRGTDVYYSLINEGAMTGRVMRLPLGGGGAVELFSDGDSTPTHLATDGTRIFWLNYTKSELWAHDGTSGYRVASVPSGSGGYAQLAVLGSFVYFAQDGGGIYRAGVDVVEGTALPIVNADAPIGLVAEAGALYYTEYNNGRVLRANPDAGFDQTPTSLAEGADVGANPGFLYLFGGMLYWIANDGIHAMETDGDNPQLLLSNEDVACTDGPCFTGLHLDERSIYFGTRLSSSATGSYYRMQRFSDGDDPVKLSAMISGVPAALTGDCGRLYAVHEDLRGVTSVVK
jgi:hypothetical protein